MNFTKTIQGWFKEEWGGSLFLPDGWYGRPYDNQLALTSIEESSDILVIVLSGRLTLSFDGLKSVKAQKRELVFGPFEKLRFDWEGFGSSGTRGTKEYLAGEVKILVNPG